MKYFPRFKILCVNREYGFSSSTHTNLLSTLLSKEITTPSKYFLNDFIDSGLELGHLKKDTSQPHAYARVPLLSSLTTH